MTERPSNTSNHQRLQEMFVHLTPCGATIPYSLCIDDEGNYWVAAKGGLFKYDSEGKKLAFERKNPFPKKVSPHCQVLCHDRKIIYAFAEDQSGMTELRIFNLDGEMTHEQFIDGRVLSLAVSEDGDMFLTKQIQGEDSIIFRASLDCPLGWDEVVSEDEYVFQALCVLDSNTLIASTCSVPVNMYSKQSLRIIDVEKQKVVKSFGSKGKSDGEIHFPRALQIYQGDILVLDKTGRIQRFSASGQFKEIAAQIDAYLGNGFIVHHDQAVIACSGIVLDSNQKTICDDWLEKINLDGTKWTPTAADAGVSA